MNFSVPKSSVKVIFAGFVIMVLGYILMIGGGSDDPTVFSEKMFSFRRIVLAPIVIVLGIVAVVLGIMRKPKDEEDK
jgi:hypothetical protein